MGSTRISGYADKFKFKDQDEVLRELQIESLNNHKKKLKLKIEEYQLKVKLLNEEIKTLSSATKDLEVEKPKYNWDGKRRPTGC